MNLVVSSKPIKSKLIMEGDKGIKTEVEKLLKGGHRTKA